LREAPAKTARIIAGSSRPTPEQIQQQAMALHGADRMMVIENGVVTFISRKREPSKEKKNRS
jgi:hypothetical protein